MTCDTWYVTCQMSHVTGGEHSLKISSRHFIQFGCEGVLKIIEQNDDLPTYLPNQAMPKVFVEQPWLHRVC